MSYWTGKVNELWDEWIALTGQGSGDPDDFINWAEASRRLALRPQDMRQLLRKQVTQALRQARRLDEDGGFTYRAKQSVTLFEGDTPVKHYFDTDKGGTSTMRQRSTKQRREAIAHDVKWTHYHAATCAVRWRHDWRPKAKEAAVTVATGAVVNPFKSSISSSILFDRVRFRRGGTAGGRASA